MDSSVEMPLNLSLSVSRQKKKFNSLEDCVNERWKAATLKAIAERFTNKTESYEQSSVAECKRIDNGDLADNKQSNVRQKATEREGLDGGNSNGILDHYHSFMQRRVIDDESKPEVYENADNDGEYRPRSTRKRRRKSAAKREDSFDSDYYSDLVSFPSMKHHSDLSPVQSFVTNMTIPERTIRQNNWALKVQSIFYLYSLSYFAQS